MLKSPSAIRTLGMLAMLDAIMSPTARPDFDEEEKQDRKQRMIRERQQLKAAAQRKTRKNNRKRKTR